MKTILIKCPWCDGDLEVAPEFILSRDATRHDCPHCSYLWITIPKEHLDLDDMEKWSIR